MMFFKKLRTSVDDLTRRVQSLDERDYALSLISRVQHLEYELRRLVDDLGLVRHETHDIHYEKKGNPEKP